MAYNDTVHLSPAPEPQSRGARVYRVAVEEMPGAPRLNHTVSQMVSMAKKRHARAMNFEKDALTARKIGEGESEVDGEYIEVVVVEP